MRDKLIKCYYWHIKTLSIMKNNLKEIRKKELIRIPTKVSKIKLFFKNTYKSIYY